MNEIDADRILRDIASSPNCTERESKMLQLIAHEWGTEVSPDLCGRPQLHVIAGGAG